MGCLNKKYSGKLDIVMAPSSELSIRHPSYRRVDLLFCHIYFS